MKSKFVLTAILIFTFAGCVQNVSPERIPDKVKATFTQSHPEVLNVTWDIEGDTFEAEREDESGEHALVLRSDGTIVIEESPLNVDQLPVKIANALKAHHSGKKVKHVAIVKSATETYYEIELGAGLGGVELLFDSDSNLIKELNDDSDEHYEVDDGNETGF